MSEDIEKYDFIFIDNLNTRNLLRKMFKTISKYKLWYWIKDINLENVFDNNTNMRVISKGGYDLNLSHENYLTIWKESVYIEDKGKCKIMEILYNDISFLWLLKHIKFIANKGYKHYKDEIMNYKRFINNHKLIEKGDLNLI